MTGITQYLNTSYRPECEFVDGGILERNVGEFEHGRLHSLLICYLATREKQWGILVLPTLRVQVTPACVRVPDISVVTGTPIGPILQQPPFLCIEILSRWDRMQEMQERVDDYLAFGVRNVWVINPKTRRAFSYDLHGTREVRDGVLATQNSDIRVVLADLG